MAARILLLHWNEAEAAERVERLRRAGFQAEYFATTNSDGGFRLIRENPPDAVVIDLGRLPSHGRAVAVSVRGSKVTRQVPLVFVEGDPQKTAQVRSLLPDAVFTTWPRIGAAVRRALKAKSETHVVPGTLVGYSGTPLPKKLRIAAGSVVALLHAPEGFAAKLEPLPPDVRLQNRPDGAAVILAFEKSAAALARELPRLAREIKAGRTLWLIWPKKTSGVATDLSEPIVREMAWRQAWWTTRCAPWMRPGRGWRSLPAVPSARTQGKDEAPPHRLQRSPALRNAGGLFAAGRTAP